MFSTFRRVSSTPISSECKLLFSPLLINAWQESRSCAMVVSGVLCTTLCFKHCSSACCCVKRSSSGSEPHAPAQIKTAKRASHRCRCKTMTDCPHQTHRGLIVHEPSCGCQCRDKRLLASVFGLRYGV